MTFTGIKQVSYTTHLSTRNSEDQFSPCLIVNISFVLVLSQEGRSYKLNNNFRHMEKYFCITSLFSSSSCHSV